MLKSSSRTSFCTTLYLRVRVSAGDTNNNFLLHSDSGLVQLKKQVDYDTLSSNTIELVVIAVDSGLVANTATLTLTVTVTDVNDNIPVCTVTAYTFDILETVSANTVVSWHSANAGNWVRKRQFVIRKIDCATAVRCQLAFKSVSMKYKNYVNLYCLLYNLQHTDLNTFCVSAVYYSCRSCNYPVRMQTPVCSTPFHRAIPAPHSQ